LTVEPGTLIHLNPLYENFLISFPSSLNEELLDTSRLEMRLLIVEDEKKVADFIALGLRAERYAVDVAHDGLAGCDLALSRPYDLLILDLLLPGYSGTEILKKVREKNGEVPILILTASAGTEEKVRNFEAGADDYLTKPFAFAELLVRVKALLRRGTPTRLNTLRVADLELDRLTQTVRRSGKKIELTSKEYSLLEFLMTNPSRVYSRTMIVEHVWDESFEALTNIVDVYVRHLRRKIDDPFEIKLIKTVRGVGYCIGNEE
jgi:two-component system copper resistance phosphate regulon response regulator CusR